MFRGISAINLDAKGRFALPTRYRERCGQHLIATIDTEENCLLLYPVEEWDVIEAKLQKLPSFNPAARRIQRLLIGHATDLEMDENGRLLLPKILREYAKLEKKAVLVGQGTKLELWDETQWESSRQDWITNGEPGELPDELLSLSL